MMSMVMMEAMVMVLMMVIMMVMTMMMTRAPTDPHAQSLVLAFPPPQGP